MKSGRELAAVGGSGLDAGEPDGDLPFGEPGRIKLPSTDRDDWDPQEITRLELRIGRDVDTGDSERPPPSDALEDALGILTEVAAGPLEQRDPKHD